MQVDRTGEVIYVYDEEDFLYSTPRMCPFCKVGNHFLCNRWRCRRCVCMDPGCLPKPCASCAGGNHAHCVGDKLAEAIREYLRCDCREKGCQARMKLLRRRGVRPGWSPL